MPDKRIRIEKLLPGFLLEVNHPESEEKSSRFLLTHSSESHGCIGYTAYPLLAERRPLDEWSWTPADVDWSTAPERSHAVQLDRPIAVPVDASLTFVGRLRKEAVAVLHRKLSLYHAAQYTRLQHSGFAMPNRLSEPFNAQRSPVPYSGRVFDEAEVLAAVGSSLDFWLTLGEFGDRFERELANRLHVRKSILTNSGSSANLLAISALKGALLSSSERLRAGDEIITCAGGFPTTVAPIVQNGFVPVFIDNDPNTGNADIGQLEEAYSPGKTRAVIFAHTLGNPFDLSAVLSFCKRHGLWLIEDNCDALGSRYALPGKLMDSCSPGSGAKSLHLRSFNEDEGPLHLAMTGSFGDLSTQSFYPPHHLTMGEGGAVNVVADMRFKRIVESFRDWGRDCWCPSGKDNTCGKRFGWQLGELPEGYDHKYIYTHLGYNLKPLDLQAAIGLQQMRKLDAFGEARRRNWHYLRTGLAGLESFFSFALPTHATGWTPAGFTFPAGDGAWSDPSWFGFMLRVRPDAPFTRPDLAIALDKARIGSRGLFGGNLLRQPAFTHLAKECPGAFRVVGNLRGADRLMHEALFLGVYPGLQTAALDYVIEFLHEFCKR